MPDRENQTRTSSNRRTAQDALFMRMALQEAELAPASGDVPVGALVVCEGKVIGRAHNEREKHQDPTAHAEILALRRASKALGRWNLAGCTLYVTLEPCVMCTGALVSARLDRLVFGAPDPKAGAVRSKYALAEDPRMNHRLAVVGGILSKEAGRLLSDFFEDLRRG